MGRHSPAIAQLDQWEADRARRRALELVAEADMLPHALDPEIVWRWIGEAQSTLAELARG